MKKILLILALGLMTMSVGAQEVAKKPSFKGFVSNGFWDNWEVSVGGGMNYVGWNKLGFRNQTNTGDNVGWTIEGSATKWFHPVVGVRLQLIGGRLNMSDGQGAQYQNNYIMPHFDGLINLSNWIGGYREDRVYYAKLFGGFGVNITDLKNEAPTGFGFAGGLINTIRVSKCLDLSLELKGILTPSHDMPLPAVAGKYAQIYSATLGVNYRFGQRNWERGVPGYTAEDIKAFQDAVAAGAAAAAAAEADKAKLAKQLKDTQDALKAAQEAEKSETAKPEKEEVVEEPKKEEVVQVSLGDQIVAKAKTCLGVPYVWNGTSMKGFDCSGLVYYVLKSLGYSPNRSSVDQYKMGSYVSKSNLKPGDLVFFAGTYKSGISHVGIYIGNGQFIHSPHSGDVVKISDLNSSYYKAHYYGARRIG